MAQRPYYISIIILLMFLITAFTMGHRQTPVVVATNLENIPMTIDGYRAVSDSFSRAVYEELNADKHIYRHYLSDDKSQIDLYIGYYGTAKGGRTPHNPYACFPSAGWGIIQSKSVKLAIDGYAEPQKINYMLIRKGDMFNIVYHWYQSSKDKVLASGLQQNIQRFVGRLLYNKNDGAFVRVSSYATTGNVDDIRLAVEAFAINMISLLPAYWPEETVL